MPFIQKRRGGFTLIEVLLVVFVLAMTALAMVAAFPSSQISRVKAVHTTYAFSLAQQKIEELRSAGYSVIEIVDSTVPLPELPEGSERLIVTQYSSTLKKVDVTVTWGGHRKVGGRVKLVTLIGDHG